MKNIDKKCCECGELLRSSQYASRVPQDGTVVGIDDRLVCRNFPFCKFAEKARQGYKCLILTERKEHAEALSYYLKREFEIITLTGDMSQRKRSDKIKQIYSGHFQILIATGQLVGEGADFQNLDCLFLVFPFAFEGKLIQYIGRIQHGERTVKLIYDYRDKNVEFLEKLFKKRQRHYNKIRT